MFETSSLKACNDKSINARGISDFTFQRYLRPPGSDEASF
jgi:hypothetical protein